MCVGKTGCLWQDDQVENNVFLLTDIVSLIDPYFALLSFTLHKQWQIPFVPPKYVQSLIAQVKGVYLGHNMTSDWISAKIKLSVSSELFEW